MPLAEAINCNAETFARVEITKVLRVVRREGERTAVSEELQTKQKLFTAWAPYVWPIKTLMLVGILLMLLQAFSTLFKDIANFKEKKI